MEQLLAHHINKTNKIVAHATQISSAHNPNILLRVYRREGFLPHPLTDLNRYFS